MLTSTLFMIVELIELSIAITHVNLIYKDTYSWFLCCNDTENDTEDSPKTNATFYCL